MDENCSWKLGKSSMLPRVENLVKIALVEIDWKLQLKIGRLLLVCQSGQMVESRSSLKLVESLKLIESYTWPGVENKLKIVPVQNWLNIGL